MPAVMRFLIALTPLALGCPFAPDAPNSPCRAAACVGLRAPSSPACRDAVRAYCAERRRVGAGGWKAVHASDPGCFSARDLVCPFRSSRRAGSDASPCVGWFAGAPASATSAALDAAPCSVDPTSAACRALAEAHCSSLRAAVASGRIDRAATVDDVGCFTADILRGVTPRSRRRAEVSAEVARATPHAARRQPRHRRASADDAAAGAAASEEATTPLPLAGAAAVLAMQTIGGDVAPCAERVVDLNVELSALPGAVAMEVDVLSARQRAVAFEPFRRHLGGVRGGRPVGFVESDDALPQLWVAWTAAESSAQGSSAANVELELVSAASGPSRRRASPRRDATRIAMRSLKWTPPSATAEGAVPSSLLLRALLALPPPATVAADGVPDAIVAGAPQRLTVWVVLPLNGSAVEATWRFATHIAVLPLSDPKCGPKLVFVSPEGLYSPSRTAVEARRARALQQDAAAAALDRPSQRAVGSTGATGTQWDAAAATAPSLLLRANSALVPLLLQHLCGGEGEPRQEPCAIDPALLAVHIGRSALAKIVEVAPSYLRVAPSTKKPNVLGFIGSDVLMAYTLTSPQLAEPIDFTSVLLAEPASLDALLAPLVTRDESGAVMLTTSAEGASMMRVDSWSLRV